MKTTFPRFSAVTVPARRMGRWLAAGLALGIVLGESLASELARGQDHAKVPLPKIRVAADHRGFVADDGTPFVPWGVTYYHPGTGWAPQVWKQFNAETTQRDFVRMKDLGVNCVHVFLSYGSFFMDSDGLMAEGLEKFDKFLAIAEAARIYVHPTGPDYWEGAPRWPAEDRMADPRALKATENFWKAFAKRYRGRSAIFAYDLRNEPEMAWDTPSMRSGWNAWLTAHYGSRGNAAKAWHVRPDSIAWGKQPPKPRFGRGPAVARLPALPREHGCGVDAAQSAAIKAADPDALVTVGLIQWSVPALLPGIEHYSAFRPRLLADLLDFQEIHFYPLASGFYDYTSAQARNENLSYLESVVREVAATGQPVVVAEFGWYGGGKLTIDQGRHPAAGDEQQAAWSSAAVRTSRGMATGWLNWGLFDHPGAGDVSQLTGLLTVNGRPKAWGREFQRLGASLAAERPAATKLGPRPVLDWDRCITSSEAGRQFRAAYLKAFLQNQPQAAACRIIHSKSDGQ